MAAIQTSREHHTAPSDLITLDRPTGDGFDPYNTGAFNRSASWERIGRNKKN